VKLVATFVGPGRNQRDAERRRRRTRDGEARERAVSARETGRRDDELVANARLVMLRFAKFATPFPCVRTVVAP